MKPGAALLAIFATLGTVWATVGTGDAAGQNLSSYEAVAAAEGVRVVVAAPGFAVVDELVDVGAPVSQSLVDGLGNSRALAANPYPGSLALSGPGLIAGFSGLPTGQVSYPLVVQSSHPTAPEASLAQPGMELEARSDDTTSSALASTTGASGDTSVSSTIATAESSRDPDTGALTATAATISDGLDVAGVLRIASVRAEATATRLPTGEVERHSSFQVDGVSIGGQAVGFSDEGIVFAGTTVPVPNHDPLLAALELAGIRVHNINSIDSPDGVASAGIAVTQQQQVPNGPNVVVTYVLGRAAAHVSANEAVTADGVGQVITGATEPPDDGHVVAAPGPSGEPAPAAQGQVASADSLPQRSGATTAAAAAPRAPVSSVVSIMSFYLILVVGATVASGGAQLLRVYGVRSAWSS